MGLLSHDRPESERRLCSNRFCLFDVVCLAVVSARIVLAWMGVFPIAWERLRADETPVT